MRPQSKRVLSSLLMFLAVFIFAIAAFQMHRHVEPFRTWFYTFAWWAYILFSQSLLLRRNEDALLFTSPRTFLALLPLSTFLWLTFEVLNFRLQNWHYINLPPQTWIRWLGYFLSFATVLPGVLTTKGLLDHFYFVEPFKSHGVEFSRRVHIVFAIGGCFCFLLPLCWPQFFFPLIWLGLVLMIEPLNYRFGVPSLLRDWEAGSLNNVRSLLYAGFVCGFLWEFWNYWAGAKWIYTVPFFGGLKVFEMPLLGFLGFPPFAMECYVFVNLTFWIWREIRHTLRPEAVRLMWVLLFVGMVVFDIIVFAGIDHFTVISFAS